MESANSLNQTRHFCVLLNKSAFLNLQEKSDDNIGINNINRLTSEDRQNFGRQTIQWLNEDRQYNG